MADLVPELIASDIGLIASAGHWLTPVQLMGLQAGDTHVWRLMVPDRLSSRLLDSLDRAELEKMRRYRHDADALRFAAGRVALRLLLAHHLGGSPRAIVLDSTCRYCGADHGKPRIHNDHDLDFNLSGSGQLVLIALAAGCVIGVDVEATERPPTGIAERVLAPAEQRAFTANELLQVWCYKEAVLKATGLGLAVEPRLVVVTQHGAGFRVSEAPPEHGELLDFSIVRLVISPAYAAALALRPSPDHLRLFVATIDELEQLVGAT